MNRQPRLVRFVNKAAVEKQTQTGETEPSDNCDDIEQPKVVETRSTQSDDPVTVMTWTNHRAV